MVGELQNPIDVSFPVRTVKSMLPDISDFYTTHIGGAMRDLSDVDVHRLAELQSPFLLLDQTIRRAFTAKHQDFITLHDTLGGSPVRYDIANPHRRSQPVSARQPHSSTANGEFGGAVRIFGKLGDYPDMLVTLLRMHDKRWLYAATPLYIPVLMKDIGLVRGKENMPLYWHGKNKKFNLILDKFLLIHAQSLLDQQTS